MDPVSSFRIPADDLGRAKDFYEKVFDWLVIGEPEIKFMFVRTTDAGGDYLSARNPGAINGAILKRGEAMGHKKYGQVVQGSLTEQSEGSSILVIQVKNLDDYLSRVKAFGGEIIQVRQMSIPEESWYAYIKDPEGNLLCLNEVSK